MVSVADAAYGARGRHHFAFEIVLDEVSPNPNPNPNPNP